MKRLPILIGLLIFWSQFYAITSQVLADFQNAVTAAKKKNFVVTLREFKPLAEQGDAYAQYNLVGSSCDFSRKMVGWGL